MLSATAEHAVRALIQLAVLGGEGAVTGRLLSQRAGIPPNYLSKILASLIHAGMISGTRGSNGGYQLVKKPDRIRLADVVDLFDNTRWRRRCFLDCGRDCDESVGCAAHNEWRVCREAFQRFLDQNTIARLAGLPQDSPAKAAMRRRRAS